MIHHGSTETRSKLLHEELTERVIGAAIEIHRALGPGLLESAYEECLCHEFHLRGISFEGAVILEIKCLEHVLPVHEAQLLTYLKMTGKRVGLILNFNVSVLTRGGIVRKVL
jgi:hypothetical protein